MEGSKPVVKRGGAKKGWIHESFLEDHCIYCGQAISTANTTVKKNHLLNPRTCTFLQSPAASNNPDPEVVAKLMSSPFGGLDNSTVLRPAKRTSSDMEASHNNVPLSHGNNSSHRSWSGFDPSVPCEESFSHRGQPLSVGSGDRRSGGNNNDRKRTHSEKLEEAEAILAALKQKHRDLEMENALMRAKEEVYTRGNRTMEDVLRLVEVHRNGLCRQTLLLNHAEAQKQASFDTIPPPWEWTPPWLHRLATLDLNAVRYIVLTGIESAKSIIRTIASQSHPEAGDLQMTDQRSSSVAWGRGAASHFLGCRLSSQMNLQKQQSQLAGLSAKSWALFFYLISTNFMTVLGNTGVFLNTGAGIHDSPGEQWYLKHARQLLPLLESEPGALDAIRSGLLVYNSRMGQVHSKRQCLKQQLFRQLPRKRYPMRASSTGQSNPRDSDTGGCTSAWSIKSAPPPVETVGSEVFQGVWRQMMGMASDQVTPLIHSEPLPPLLAAESARLETPIESIRDNSVMDVRLEDLQLMRLLLEDGDGEVQLPAAARATGMSDDEISRTEANAEPPLGVQSQQPPTSRVGGNVPVVSDGAAGRISVSGGVCATGSGGPAILDGSGEDDGPEFGGTVKDDALVRMHEIQQQLLVSFRQEAAERMLFNSMLQRVLTYEAEVCCYMLPYWPDRPKLMEYVIMCADHKI